MAAARAIFLLFITTVSFAACTSVQCTEPENASALFIARWSGGPAPYGSRVIVWPDGHIRYFYGHETCALLGDAVRRRVFMQIDGLPDVLRAAQNRRDDDRYADVATIVVDEPGVRTVIAVRELPNDPFLPHLKVLDEIFRQTFKHRYRYPILPPEDEMR